MRQSIECRIPFCVSMVYDEQADKNYEAGW